MQHPARFRNSDFPRLLILLLCLAGFAVQAKGQPYELTGIVTGDDGTAYSYKMSFSLKKDLLEGISSSGETGKGIHTAVLKGTVDRRMHTLSFRETKVLQCPGGCGGHCLFSGEGRFDTSGSSWIFKGHVSARPEDDPDEGEICMRGGVAMNVNSALKQLLNDRQQSGQMPADVQSLGTLSPGAPLVLDWQGKQLHITLYDDREEDGDRLTLTLNEQVMTYNQLLTKAGTTLDGTLRAGMNILILHAENNGTLPPNTSRIILSDGQHSYALQTIINAHKDAQIRINVTP